MSEGLYAYAAGELDEAADTAFEEQLFGDPALVDEAGWLMGALDALAALRAQGPLVPVITDDEVAALAQRFRLLAPPIVGGRLVAVIGEVDYVLARIRVDLSDAQRVDVQVCGPDGRVHFVVHQAPFGEGGVNVLCRAHVARAAGNIVVRVLDQNAALRAEVSIENLAP